MLRLLPHSQVVVAWTSQRRTYAVLMLSISFFAAFTVINLSIFAALIILERAPTAKNRWAKIVGTPGGHLADHISGRFKDARPARASAGRAIQGSPFRTRQDAHPHSRCF